MTVVKIVEEADVPDDPGDEDEDVEDEAGDHVVVRLLAAKYIKRFNIKFHSVSMFQISGPVGAGNVSAASSCSVDRRVSVN